LESVEKRQLRAHADCAGKLVRLVEVALLLALMVKRNRHQRPFLDQGCFKAEIRERLLAEPPKLCGKMDFPPVFEAVNQIKRPRIPNHCGAGELEGKLELRAIRTSEFPIDFTLEGFSARHAKWSRQAG